MSLTRQEVNFRRLLAKCELLCKSNQKNDERFPKYIETLDEMLKELKKLLDDQDVLMKYFQRITTLKSELGMVTSNYDSGDTFINQRKELFGRGSKKTRDNKQIDIPGLRQRNVENTGNGTDNLDDILNYNEDMQKKITDDVLELTKSLKEQTQLANRIIRKDTEVITRSSQLTEQNFNKLTTESVKLTEHTKRACKCWMWLMLLIVVLVFIGMVLFMKVAKKSY